jgi:deoxyribodipyrimidine photolyase-related protein
MRNLILVLGDQLDPDNPALTGIDRKRDSIVMIEAAGEATHVWSHQARITLFLSAMRHYAETLRSRDLPLQYLALDNTAETDLKARLGSVIAQCRPEKLIVCEPGEFRLQQDIEKLCLESGITLEVRADSHFLCTREEFAAWAKGRRELRMEFFYREMRRRHDVMMEDGQPAGGRWNFDSDNRAGFAKSGPGPLPQAPQFAPDAITRDVIALVRSRFAQHPGSLADFNWPVTRADALHALQDFVQHRLPRFGQHQDAMWTGMPFGWHSLLSTALNLKLLNPREVIAAAVAAWREDRAPLAATEGFVRQILGWREFIRGVYWLDMPGLLEANHFGHDRALPAWYWTGDTAMTCMREAIGQTLKHGYAHHIQRLMVTGNFALLSGISPQAVHEWYLAVYVDAVEWVELPNTHGMALYANGGRFTSKPYIASGAYINRMSNYCKGCSYDVKLKTGAKACPFNTLYWYFLDRHEKQLARNPRTVLMARNVSRLSTVERDAIRASARNILETLG